jgi:hypothetical protein
MPNYKLTASCLADMTNAANNLCNRRVNQAKTGFPLTNDHIRAALILPKWRATFEQMQAEGVDTISKTTTSVHIVNHWMPGVERDVLLWITHRHEYHTSSKHARGAYYVVAEFNRGDASVNNLVLDPSILTDGEQAALAKWINNVVQEKRLTNIAKSLIGGFFSFLISRRDDTMAHVIARWPALKYLVQDNNIWRDRFNNAPRNLKPYGWSLHDWEHGWYAKHAKAMALTDMVLTSAAMLPATIENTDEVKAIVVSWRPLPHDLDHPA